MPLIPKFHAYIVDDSQVVAERLKLMLTEMEFISVIGVSHDMASAMKAMHVLRPNIAILDIHLKHDVPYFNGMHLLALLRKLFPEMIIIMLTNVATPENRERCKQLGANYFFDKTNEIEKLQETLYTIYRDNRK